MSDSTDKKCADVIASQMAARAAYVGALFGRLEADSDEEEAREELDSFGLEVQRKVSLKFLMSTGGPADWLEILCGVEDYNGTSYLEVESVTYHFADWFDHAELDVPEGSPLYDLAEQIAEGQ